MQAGCYKRAEDLIHSLGIETGEGIDTTAINELRYAGRPTGVARRMA